MKISDFSGITTWDSGSQMNLIATGTYRGNTYQVKIHAREPKWYFTAAEIEKKKAELRNCSDDDRERLQNELASLQAAKENRDKEDKIADDYLTLRKDLIKTVNSAGSPLLVPPADAWKEPIPFKNDVTFMVEATPWLKTVCWFTPDKPVCFSRDLTEAQQYELIASLADSLAKLHKAGVVHGDLKVGNTVIVEQGGKRQVALIDYDGSILLKDLWSKKYPVDVWTFALCGTYYSPEQQMLFDSVFEDPGMFEDFDVHSITEKTDIFSLAFTIYEYFYGELDSSNMMPFVSPEGEPLDSPYYGLAVMQDYKPKFPDDPNAMSDLLYAALNWMLDKEPVNRPTAEQVSELFRTQDLTKVPRQYQRIDPCAPWESDNIEFLPLPDGVRIVKILSKEGRYSLQRNGLSMTRDARDLISEGYAKKIGEAAAAEAAAETRDFWPSDASGEMPPCVKRAAAEGKYILSYVNMFNTVSTETCTYMQLKQKGVVCSDEDLLKPWPNDSDMHYLTTRTVKRNLKKGPGHYIVVTVPTQYLTTEQMYQKNYATKAVTFRLNGKDDEKYAVKPEGVPSNVESITRDSIRGYGYRIKYKDGSVERVLVEDLLAKGFVVRK